MNTKSVKSRLHLTRWGAVSTGRIIWGCDIGGYSYRCYSSKGAWVAYVIRLSDGVKVDSVIPLWSKRECKQWLQDRANEVSV